MHQHPRLPPVTASPANSARTNPTRTNNPRDQEGGPARSAVERGSPGEQGPGEATVTQGRAYDPSVDGRDNIAKLSQVIQVRYWVGAEVDSSKAFRTNANLIYSELSHQSSLDNSAVEGLIAPCIYKRNQR